MKTLKSLWNTKTRVVPVVVWALGSVSKASTGHLEQLGIPDR